MLFNAISPQTVGKILGWHANCTVALAKEKAYVKSLAELAEQLPQRLETQLPRAATIADIDAYFDSCRAELDLAATLFLIANTEARIRKDAAARKHPHANAFASRLQLVFKGYSEEWQVPLYQGGILEEWIAFARQIPGLIAVDRHVTRIGAFKNILQLRHWVAHGRHWSMPSSAFVPEAIATLIGDLTDTLAYLAASGGVQPFPN